MAIAHYKTERGAKRYCAELAVKHPTSEFKPVPSDRFGYNVRVTLANGKTAVVGKRPVRFSKSWQIVGKLS